MSGAVALGQVSDGALERKANLARVCGGVRDAHDHGDHLVDPAACRRHLRKRAGHLVETVARLVRVPHQLVQVAVHLVDALAGGVHDGLDIAGLLGVLVPAAHHLVHREALYQLLSGVHEFVRDVHQCRRRHDLESAEMPLQYGQRFVHRPKVHVLCRSVQLLEALLCPLELQLLHQAVYAGDGLPGVFFKVCVVKPHFDNAAVYFLTHSLLTSPHALAAIRSKIGRIAGLM